MKGGPGLLGFEVLGRLHGSDRSAVYRARRGSDDRDVLVKVSGPGVSAREAAARYRRERELLDSLSCAGAIRVLEVIERPDLAALVLEDVGGETLKERLRRGPLPIGEAIDIGRALARALDDLHDAGIMHRDLNAYNVVANPVTRAVRIIDFELATRWRLDGPGVTPGALAGRLPYLAPEQIGRMNRRVDSRADLYALGVTLYELLTGRTPFERDDGASWLAHLQSSSATRPQRIDCAALPPVISDIVVKLLAEPPEWRYQTAAAVEADLAECASRLAQSGAIAPFAIARNDVSSRFDFSEKLYGREAEIAMLGDAFARAAAGAAEVVLVSGYSGIGKTSIVRELRVPVMERGGLFASGKLDPLFREGAHVALVSAIEGLVDGLVGESPEALASWRERILLAVGANGRALIEALPSLELVIGPQPALAPLESAAELARFCLTLQRFIQVFARREHPLVLFLDDLQWADGATLTLLRMLATSVDTEALLIVGAYRDNQVGGTHQLFAFMEELGRRGGHLQRIAVAPLADRHVVGLLADTLHRPPAEVTELVDVVVRKTDGNPFFIRQLLLALHAERHIRFDGPSRCFVFDIASIHDAPITDNVADVLTENLERLPVTTQRILTLAAAVGNRFDLTILAVIADLPLERVSDELQLAVAEGLVVPLSDLEYFDDDAGQPWLMGRWFGFQHDRIHEAAHAQLTRSERERLHVTIGRLILERTPADELDERVFDIVQHLGRGLALIVEPAERARIAAVTLRAGRRARDAGAYDVAVASYRCAVRLRDWSEDYPLAYEAHHGLATSLQLSLDVVGALEVVEAAAAHTKSKRDSVAFAALKASLFFHRGEIRKAVDCCRQGARLLGVELPCQAEALEERTAATLASIFAALERAPIESLLDLPPMTDLDTVALMTLAMSTMAGAFQVDRKLFVLLAATTVSLSLRDGNCAASARAYATFAIVLHGLGRESEAIRFGKLGRDLAKRLGDRLAEASVGCTYAAISAPWLEPIDRCIDELREARSAALEAGAYPYMGYSAAIIASFGLWKGVPLGDLAAEAERDHKLVLELGEPSNASVLAALLAVIRSYATEIDAGAPLAEDRPIFDKDNQFQRAYVEPADLERAFILGDAREALAIADRSTPILAAVPDSFNAVVFRFFHCLAVTAVWSEEGRDVRELMLAGFQTAMRDWADRCPTNFAAMYLLVEAERARVGDRPSAALDRYDEAIAAATRYGLVKLEALGNELAARFWLGRDKRDIALVYAHRALMLYAQWGARRKVQLLERELAISSGSSGRRGGDAGEALSPHDAGALDLAVVLQAANLMSGEFVLERLLAAMMNLIVESFGAQAAALVLDGDGSRAVRAARTSAASAVTVFDGAASGDGSWIPSAILNYVLRRRESLVVDDAGSDARFAGDPVVRARRLRSILCAPVRHQGVVMGALYLENGLIAGAFSPSQLGALSILVAQIAVSIENARLRKRATLCA